eukprot:SAG11_NODE_3856_length_2189_cov_5.252632_2_plen_365_part_00
MAELRHECSESDPIRGYGWSAHDGRTYGAQTVADDAPAGGVGAKLHTSFVKPGGEEQAAAGVAWASRIAVEPAGEGGGGGPTAVYWYFGADCDGELNPEKCAAAAGLGGGLSATPDGEGGIVVAGSTAAHGPFSLTLRATATSGGEPPALSYWGGRNVLLADITKKVTLTLKKASGLGKKALKSPTPKAARALAATALPGTVADGANVVAVRLSCTAGCVVDSVLHQGGRGAASAAALAQVGAWLAAGQARFAAKMAAVFGEFEGFGPQERASAAAALSNAIGGMAYLSGRMPVQGGARGELESFSTALFTAVPSRPFFPRGFAWDEGFHQLLIRRCVATTSCMNLKRRLRTIRPRLIICRSQL